MFAGVFAAVRYPLSEVDQKELSTIATILVVGQSRDFRPPPPPVTSADKTLLTKDAAGQRVFPRRKLAQNIAFPGSIVTFQSL